MEKQPPSLRSQIFPLLFLVWIFFLNFLSRIILSPLMPTIEQEIKIGHGEAGSLFFLISFGYCLMLFASGFISQILNHRKIIILSAMTLGMGLLIVGLSRHLWTIRIGLLWLGMAAGLYLPSGIATITELVDPKDWGKAVAIHELAPNLGFLAAPLLSEFLLGWASWQRILMLIGLASLLSGLLFIRFGRGGVSHGTSPNVGTLQNILRERSFWIMMFFFSLGIGGSFGVFSMLPLYLVSEKGLERVWANTLVGLSRIPTLGTAILAGWVTDRLGPQKALKMIFMATGVMTILLGLISGGWLFLLIFIQPIVASSFFPPGFAGLSRIGEGKFKNLAVAFTVPVGMLIGGGVIPAGIGLMGETGFFSLGFIFLGGLFFGGLLLVQHLKFGR
ncbi:MAG: MFS transporter [Thermodesulfobacteriota bacterium]